MAERPSTELRLELIEARLRAQEVALHWLFKAIASIDSRSGHAVALALEVVELEQLELTGEEDATVRFLRRFREQIEEPQFEQRDLDLWESGSNSRPVNADRCSDRPLFSDEPLRGPG